jgi:hypothetical protein
MKILEEWHILLVNLISVKLVMFYLLLLWIESFGKLLRFPTHTPATTPAPPSTIDRHKLGQSKSWIAGESRLRTASPRQVREDSFWKSCTSLIARLPARAALDFFYTDSLYFSSGPAQYRPTRSQSVRRHSFFFLFALLFILFLNFVQILKFV